MNFKELKFEEIKKICEESRSYKEISEKFGWSYGGRTLVKIKKAY